MIKNCKWLNMYVILCIDLHLKEGEMADSSVLHVQKCGVSSILF